jgi:hypothetical protein
MIVHAKLYCAYARMYVPIARNMAVRSALFFAAVRAERGGRGEQIEYDICQVELAIGLRVRLQSRHEARDRTHALA